MKYFKQKYYDKNIIVWVDERIGPHFIEYKYRSLDGWSGINNIKKETKPHYILLPPIDSSAFPEKEYNQVSAYIQNRINQNYYLVDNSFNYLKVYFSQNNL